MIDTTGEAGKIVLAYPPYTSPMGPPLGVCTLKGYVERTVPGWTVRVVDLTVAFIEHCLASLDDENPVVLEGESVDPHTLRRSAECFRGQAGAEFYGQPDRYGMYSRQWHSFMPAAHRALAKQLEGGYRNAEAIPEIVEQMAESILAERPDAVGISICYDEQFWFGICLAKAIKRRASLPIIFGGTFFVEDSEAAFNSFQDVIDYIVTGEGEMALAQLLSKPDSLEEVPGLWWREDGKARLNPQVFERKLDVFGHPDFSDLDLASYFTPEPVIPILTSRGCYWKRCAFCTHYQSYGLTYRMHSVDFVIEEMKRHIANGIGHFSLVDELLSANRFDQLATAIIEEGLDVRYYAMSRPTKEFSRERLQRMFDSGCRFMMWGMESANQRVLDLIEKGTIKSEVRELLHTAAEVGLYNHVFMFLGFPTETRDEAIETLQFLNENRDVIHEVLRGTFGLSKGSPIFDDPRAYSITRMQPKGSYPHHAVFDYKVSKGLTAAQATELLEEAMPYLRSFNPYSSGLSKNREHALLIYSRLGRRLDPGSRRFQPFPFSTGGEDVSDRIGQEHVTGVDDVVPSGERGPTAGERSLRMSLLRAAVFVGARMRVLRRFKHRKNLRRYPGYEIREYPGFLSPGECEYLIEAARPVIDPARRDRGRERLRPIDAANKVYLIQDDRIRLVKERIADLTGTVPDRQEKIQVVCYGALEFCPSHFDNVGQRLEAGDREHAVIVYLNDGFKGGGNYFSELGRRIVPERGKAVVFRVLTEDSGEPHPLSRHMDEIALSGEKWVCNQWIRQRPFPELLKKTSTPRGSRASGSAKGTRSRPKKKRGGRRKA